jgi:hypothetical protein
MRASKLLGTAVAALVLLCTTSGYGKESLPGNNPWRDSEIDYEHTVSALSFSKSADPTYNPYYAHRLYLMPYWHVGDLLTFKARLIVEQELTSSIDSETLKKHEVTLSDLTLDASYAGFTEPFTGIKFKGGIRFTFPTSKASQAMTMRMGIGPGVAVERKFPLLEGLTLSYAARLNFYFYQFTTAQNSSPWVACGGGDNSSPGCDNYVQNGTYNAWASFIHGPEIIFAPTDKLTVDLTFYFWNSYLYGLAGQPVLGDADAQKVRYSQWLLATVSYQVLDYLGVSLGFSSQYSDLRPDGKYRAPFLNRNTQLFLDLNFTIDPLVQKFQ